MKIAVLSDIHFGVRNNNPVYLDHFLKLFHEVFLPACRKENVTWCAIAGDVFDHRKMTNIDILRTVNKRFWPYMIDQFTGGTVVIPGNHDIYHTNTLRVNALEEHLPIHPKIILLMKPTVWTFDRRLNVLFVPWICEENQDECIDALAKNAGTAFDVQYRHRNSDVSHVIGHFHLQGHNMGNGQVAEDGMKEDIFVGSYKSVASGHFHTLSKVYRHYYRQGEHRGTTIQYLGAPYEMTWGDWNDPKGFHFLNTENGEYEFVRNPYVLHKKIIYDDTNFITSDEIIEEYRNTFVRLIITKKTQPSIFDAFVDSLEKVAYDVKIIDQTSSIPEIGSSPLTDNDLYAKIAGLDTDDVWAFIKQAIDEGSSSVDKAKLERFMGELYQEALLKQS